MALKRRTTARLAAAHPKLKAMEQKAHTNAVQTYIPDILKHLTELESTTKMNPQMIQSQPQITVAMRPILFDFLMDVHNRLKLSSQTFFLTINIIDRYCSLRIVRKDHYQLLGLTALWLASKYCDSKNKIPSIEFLRATCCHCYSKNLFVEMESHILKSLEWNVGSSTHDAFIDLLLKENALDFKPERVNDIKYGANYLSQLSQFSTRITFNYSTSMISIASVLIMTNSLSLLNDNQFVHFNTQTGNSFKLNKLCALILSVIRENPLPASIDNKFFKSNNDNTTLDSIVAYANEFRSHSQFFSPSTPLYNTPMASRTSSTSSQSSNASSLLSKSSAASSLMTPPTSCTASPIEFNAGQNNSIDQQKAAILPLQDLKIQCLPTFSSNYTTTPQHVQLQDIERKRTNSWGSEDQVKRFLSQDNLASN
ncbi:Cyclin-B1-2 [Wickerhamomyces ciferrii]|uniref:Cyclin-B1-2 n=1 Tax=Wickerhamomyces ciferrii (strain ATCC 14091 / BCRC 22168 / CBS 111 / JCM 3599 / NBRC 0793 / NRRL Y-1031 F-60-10) TaxID=1206466 RepID=K0KLI1_WICCF|nr:Cyclin-B1-2 [Wickerhamomyces ciferrii]CCH42219.1 Cyclin-B1-2 [Wickerhamomyces ciferrii]